jgi:DeoR/GlpR family transcriptional regulator of sugar metabolism
VAFATVAPLSAIDAVVTDAPAAHQAVGEIAAAGVEVIEAKVPEGDDPR